MVIGLITVAWAIYNYNENIPTDQLLELIALNYRLEDTVSGVTGVRSAVYDPLASMEEARNFSVLIGTFGGFFVAIGAVCAVVGSGPSQAPSKKSAAKEEPKERPAREKQSLANADYKLWLVSEYNIQRNDVLAEYLCGDKLFPTIDDALAFAHSVDLERQEKGVLTITAVQGGSAADKVGLKVGDKLLSYNGQRCASSDDLARAIKASRPGSARAVLLLRNGDVIKRVVSGGTLGVAGNPNLLTDAELSLARSHYYWNIV